MSLSPIKKQVLETLSRCGKPMRATEVAKDIGQKFQPVMMNILGLIRMGYVCVPEKGLYILTDKGKEVLTPETIAKEQVEVKETPSQPETIEKPKEEIPQPETITKEQAEVILAYSPHDKAFHFYVNVGQPLDLHAHGLRDFANKVERVDVESVQFHMNRSDFEAWFVGLGDTELAKKVAALKEKNVVGDDLRKQLHELVEQRYMELAKLAGQPICIE